MSKYICFSYVLSLLLMLGCDAVVAPVSEEQNLFEQKAHDSGAVGAFVPAADGGTIKASSSKLNDEIFKKVILEIPAGALSDDTIVTVMMLSDLLTGSVQKKLEAEGSSAGSPAIYVSLEKGTLKKPLRLFLPYGQGVEFELKDPVMQAVGVFIKDAKLMGSLFSSGDLEPAADGSYILIDQPGVYQLVETAKEMEPRTEVFGPAPEGTKLLDLLKAMLGVAPKEVPPDDSPLCANWGEPEKIGTLDTALINEASGLAVSRTFKKRLYHVNDSGDESAFYVTDLAGKGTKKVVVEGVDFKDVEDLSLGPCKGGKKTCLFIADIGDNHNVRSTYEIIVIEEQETYGDAIAPLNVLTFKFPQWKIDSEGFAVHPNGDGYLIRKAMSENSPYYATDVYRIPAAMLADDSGEVQVVEAFGSLDMLYVLNVAEYLEGLLNKGDWSKDLYNTNPMAADASPALGKVVTSFDIAPDGKTFIILTYLDAVEFAIDVSEHKSMPFTGGMKYGIDYTPIKLSPQSQQEAIAYLPNERGFLYTSELAQWSPEAPIMRVMCAK